MSALPHSEEWWRPEATAAPAAVDPVGEATPQTGGGKTAYRALLTFTLILLLAPQELVPILRPFRIALLSALVAIAAHLSDRFLFNRPVAVWGKEVALLGALVGWAVLTLPFSYWPGGSYSFLLDFYFKTVAIFWLLATVVDDVERLRTLAWSLGAMAVPLAATGVKNFLSGNFIAGASDRIAGYAGGLTSNPNDLALMLNLILPLTLALLVTARRPFMRGVLAAMALVEIGGVITTFSRGGFLTLATIIALHLWRQARRGAFVWAFLGVTACAAGSLLLPSGYVARLATIVDNDADATGSAQERRHGMGMAVQIVMESPVTGAGVGMNAVAINRATGASWSKVHNVYLEYAVDLGLPGLLLFLLLLRACLARVRSVRRASAAGMTELSSLAEGIEIALIAFSVAALFHPVAYHFYFYYPAGLAVAAGSIHRGLSRRAEGYPPTPSVA